MVPTGSNLGMSTIQLAGILLDDLESDRSNTRFTLPELEALEGRLLTALSSVRTFRNAQSPVQRLLPETLVLIFSMVREDFSSFLPRHRFSAGVNSWMNVTHVCRYWRNTALEYPSLWSTIHSFDKAALRVSLTRSEQSPLKVYLFSGRYDPCPALDDTDILGAMAANAYRFQEFHLRQLCSHTLRASILNHFSLPAPHLESLSIALDEEDTPNSASLPVMFNGHMPCLRRLSLRYFTSWPANSFTGLTHLCLYRQSETGRATLTQFLDFLEASPLLEELVLVDAGPAISDLILAPPPPRTIELMNLHTLDMGLWPSAFTIGCFLQHLLIPQGTNISIWGRNVLKDEENINTIFPSFSPQRNSLCEIKRLRVTDANTFGRPFPFIAVRGAALQINGSFKPSQVLLAVSDVCTLAHVEELWVGDRFRPEPTLDEWRALFASMPRLKTLVIARRLTEPILFALIADETHPPGAPPLCPALDTIRIHVYDTAAVSTLFLSVLAQQRAADGRPLQCLRTSIFDISPTLKHEVMYLQRYIPSVECDGEYEEHKKMELLEGWPSDAYIWTKCENA